MPVHLTESEFAALVDEAIRQLPQEFAEHMENLSVEIRMRPTRKLLEEMELGDDMTLLGVYQGVPLTEKSVNSIVEWPQRILIFQRNVEAVCDSSEEVVEQVRTTVLHEIGHHFGMDEDDLDELGYG